LVLPSVSIDLMQIQPFQEQHRAAVITLWQTCGLTRPWNDPGADIDRALTNVASDILLSFDGDKLIGTVMVGYEGHRGWVYYLAADPGRRGEGIGRNLMTVAEDWLRDRGCPKILLMVRDSNHAVRRFYENLGYDHQNVTALGRWLIDPPVPQGDLDKTKG